MAICAAHAVPRFSAWDAQCPAFAAGKRQRVQRRRKRLEVAARQGPLQSILPPGPPPSVPEPGLLVVGAIMGFQAAALIGAVVTGVLARQRREEMQGLNRKLRHINSELRRQREAQDSLLSAAGMPGVAREAGEEEDGDSGGEGPDGGIAGIQAAAALDALRRQREAMQEERSILEQVLQSPSAAHPTEGFGDQRLSLACARRQIANSIRGSKELVRDGRPGEVFPVIEQGLQLALEMADLRAERALMRVRARALREAGDPTGALRDLQRSTALSQQLGEAGGDADTYGELGDILTELGDLEAAGKFYDLCISAIQTETQQPLSSTWDMS